ncbi:phospholipase A [Glacieibacterium sp.]|uniref:phospholipase A n=1 Tax=Glacieibacterium sp. TaxID=2860237 RepID=UPI003B0048D7
MTRMLPWAIGLFLSAATGPTLAAGAVQTLIGAVRPVQAGGTVTIEIVYLNTGATALQFEAPARLTADLAVGGAHSAITLERDAGELRIAMPAGGFARQLYRATLPARGSGEGVVSLPDGPSFALALPATGQQTAAASTAPAPTAPVVVQQSLSSPSGDTGNAFLGSLSAYQPIYAVYGPGTNTDAKIQISFKYQLFGQGGAIGTGRSLLDGVHFAYTQRLYWDLGAKSSPFRNVDYNPELLYIVPAPVKPSGLAIGGRFGIAHESNGRDGDASRSANTIYVQPVATLPVGSYRMSVGPRLWTYFGDLSDNPDIRRYRGNTGLFLEIGQDDGLRVTTNSRLNFGSGKGAIDVSASYPLNRLIASNLNLYLFGQAFTGYGENLLDYDKHQTRVRFGLGFVR